MTIEEQIDLLTTQLRDGARLGVELGNRLAYNAGRVAEVSLALGRLDEVDELLEVAKDSEKQVKELEQILTITQN